MIEYIYDIIRATSGEDITISARITDEAGTPITSGCGLRIFDKDESFITRIEGTCVGEMWSFTVPGELTENMKGKYWYCMCQDGKALSFKEPLYLV
jgi:hypothetical protein